MKKIFGIFLIIIGTLLWIYLLAFWALFFMSSSIIAPIIILSIFITINYLLFAFGFSLFRGISVKWRILINIVIFLLTFNLSMIAVSYIDNEVWHYIIPSLILSFITVKIVWRFHKLPQTGVEKIETTITK
mgnify:FL=1